MRGDKAQGVQEMEPGALHIKSLGMSLPSISFVTADFSEHCINEYTLGGTRGNYELTPYIHSRPSTDPILDRPGQGPFEGDLHSESVV